MRKFVFEFVESVYMANNKTEQNIKELQDVLVKYGVSQDYDTHMANACKQYIETIDYLKKEIEKIKAYNVSEDELAMLIAHRNAKDKAVKSEKEYSSNLEKTLTETIKTHKETIKRISSAIPSYEDDSENT